MSAAWSAPTFEVVVDFRNGQTGSYPETGLTVGTDGFLYGTTHQGGLHSCGTVFRISTTGTLTTLAHFEGTTGTTRGKGPTTPLLRTADGTLYGTTSAGGLADCGTVFRLDPDGTFQTLADFTGSSGPTLGRTPASSLVFGPDGALYGTTRFGGTSDEYGTLFSIDTGGTLTTLHRFDNIWDGIYPCGSLQFGPDGILHGTCSEAGQPRRDAGTIFRWSAASGFAVTGTFQDIATLPGKAPFSGLRPSQHGVLLGTTAYGGKYDQGTVFAVDPVSQSARTLVQLPVNDGATLNHAGHGYPVGGLTTGPDGNYYGLGLYAAYRLSLGGDQPELKFLATRPRIMWSHDPSYLCSDMTPVFGPDGNIYGTSGLNSSEESGFVWRLRFGPTPTTKPPIDVTFASASLQAEITTNGEPSSVAFEWGLAPTELNGTLVAVGTPRSTTPVPVGATLYPLAPQTTYFYRVRAENRDSLKSQFGEIMSFTTPPIGTPPVKTLVVAHSPGASCVLHFSGPPGAQLQLQRRTSIDEAAWGFLANVTIPASGILIYEDTTAPEEQAYYRLVNQ